MFGKLINNDQLWDSTLVKLLDFKDMKKNPLGLQAPNIT